MANWYFDPSQYKEQSFEIIPIGEHRVRIADVVERSREQKNAFSSGNEGYEITLDVNGHNSKLWFYLVLDASNPQQTNQRIGDFFNSFGITNPVLGTGKQWIGAVGAVRVKHEEYNGSNSAKVAYCVSRKNQDKLPAWKNGNTSAAPQMDIPSINEDDLPFDM